jgi:uncharacterized protein
MNRSRVRALVTFTGLAGAALLALAAPAAAHVTVHSSDAVQGGEAELTFRVPTESATASTTKLAVQLPTATPFASVLVKPMTGWAWSTHSVKLPKPITDDDGDQVSEAVSEVDWSADSAADAIKPGEYDDFSLSVGPLPTTKTIAFAAIQTYSDGTVVSWNEVAAPGSSVEPDHPKPVLTLAPAPGGTTTSTATKAASSSDTGPVVLSIAALVVAAAALGLVVVARARRERS